MKILTIDIGGTSIKSGVALVTSCDTIIDQIKSTTFDSDNPSASIIQCINKYDFKEYGYIAVSATGVIDSNGIVIATNGQINNYLNLDIKSLVTNLTGKETIVINDVTAIGYAELDNVPSDSINLVLALGTGIGGCLIYKNQILEGARGAFCEVGQLVINNQRFEQLASTKALIELAKTKYKLPVKSGIEFFENYQTNMAYDMCFDEWIMYLAQGIEQLLYCYNPDTVIIAGGISEQSDLIIPKLTAKLKHLKTPYIGSLVITTALHKNDAGMYGAVKKLRSQLC